MPDDENGNDDNSPQDMSESDLLTELMGLLSREGISDSKLRKILAHIDRVVSEPD
jgi:hypothetical protein